MLKEGMDPTNYYQGKSECMAKTNEEKPVLNDQPQNEERLVRKMRFVVPPSWRSALKK